MAADIKQYVMLWPTEGSKSTYITPNWCDKTTWYYSSVRVVDEIASDDGAHTVYSLAHTYVIDTYHGKLSYEDVLVDGSNNSFRVVVKVNDVTKTERDPHVGSGGDYTVNYVDGKITFSNALAVDDVVKVTYYYATTSTWVLKPDAGKILKIRRVEAQFSKDTILTDTVQFQLYVGGSPYGPPMQYKTMMDFINESNGSWPIIPAVGGSNWRSLPQDVYTYAWDYVALTALKSSIAMEIRIKLEHDVPFTGTSATASFYCLSESE